MNAAFKKNVKMFWRGWGYSIVMALIVATSFKSVIADWNVVPTGSMKPTIVEGDRIFVNKLAYDLKIPYSIWHLAQWADPQQGDIVVFYSPADGKRLVKRVVGTPGDTVQMVNNKLIINGVEITYAPENGSQVDNNAFSMDPLHYRVIENLGKTRHPVMVTPVRPAMRSFGPVTVPENHYFMMGDNRDNSADSRFFGFVAREQIVGRATMIVASLDIQHHYQPRWERFFTALP